MCVGHCKDGAACNHVNGLCDGRCDRGWTGTSCNEGICSICDLPFYGTIKELDIVTLLLSCSDQ